MRRPTNIALDPAVRVRLKIVAAQLDMRPCDVVNEALIEKLPEYELQAKANKHKESKR